jgi:hypothetical protein
VDGWRPKDGASGVACALASASDSASATASLRNAVARPKVSPMVWPASWASYAWYRLISHDRLCGASDASFDSGTGLHVQPVIRPAPEPWPPSPGSMNSARSASSPIRLRTKRSPARVCSVSWSWGGRLARHDPVVGGQVVAHERGVDDGDPPHRLADQRERPRVVPCGHAVQPFSGVVHRRDRPLQRAPPSFEIAGMLPVPGRPARGRAEPGVLAARHERGAALLTGPGLSHHWCSPK